jgi:trk system potassium uptake protein TrkA
VHIVIVGCGRVGSTLAKDFAQLGHTVAIIDRKADAFSRLGEYFPGEKIVGIGFDRDVLTQAGIERADAVAAVTNGDNSNIMIARVARENYGITRVVARIYDPKRSEIYERLGIATVATVKWTAERIMRRIIADRPAVEWTDPSAAIVVVERELGDAWVGAPMRKVNSGPGIVVGYRRFGAAALPDANTIIQQGDVLYVSVAADNVATLDRYLIDARDAAS